MEASTSGPVSEDSAEAAHSMRLPDREEADRLLAGLHATRSSPEDNGPPERPKSSLISWPYLVGSLPKLLPLRCRIDMSSSHFLSV